MAPAESGEAKPVLTQAELNAIADEAVTRWTEALDLDGSIQTQLADVTFQIADLSGPTLGLASSDTILIDAEGLNPVEAFAAGGPGGEGSPLPSRDAGGIGEIGPAVVGVRLRDITRPARSDIP